MKFHKLTTLIILFSALCCNSFCQTLKLENKENLLYLGVLNYFNIECDTLDCNSIVLTTNNGAILKSADYKEGTYYIIPKRTGSTKIYVSDARSHVINDSFVYDVKRVSVAFPIYPGGVGAYELLYYCCSRVNVLSGFNDHYLPIDSIEITILRQGKVVYDKKLSSRNSIDTEYPMVHLDENTNSYFADSIKVDDQVIFPFISYRDYDGTSIKLNSVMCKVIWLLDSFR